MFDESKAQHKIDTKTKPLGALGRLEDLAFKLCKIQKTLNPKVDKGAVFIFGADHGLSREGVSCYPQEVTKQMFYNFASGGAAINVFTKQFGLELKVIDAGVNSEDDSQFDSLENVITKKIAHGTRSSLKEKAMTDEQLEKCFEAGQEVINKHLPTGCNLIAFGEMGIGNTASSSLIMARLLNLDLETCTGRGTGLDDNELKKKVSVLKEVASKHNSCTEPKEVLQAFGGFEMAQMTAAIIAAYESGLTILIDGFISSTCLLVASRLRPEVLDNVIFSHCSNEHAHALLLESFSAKPLLDLDLRLGEGTGSALAYPLLQAACAFMNDMASFESASVSSRNE